MPKNFGFSVRESGVGGILVVVPIAREGVGGWVGRRVRICDWGLVGEGKTYYSEFVSRLYSLWC